jgi:hypothetical protein
MQGLKCKWISAQELRLTMGYTSLIKTALDLDLVDSNWFELVKIN